MNKLLHGNLILLNNNMNLMNSYLLLLFVNQLDFSMIMVMKFCLSL